MNSLNEQVNAKRVLNNGIVIKHVYEMLDFAEEFKDIKLYWQPIRDNFDYMDYLDYLTMLHDDLLDYFIEVQDLDSTGEVTKKINNFKFSVDSTEE